MSTIALWAAVVGQGILLYIGARRLDKLARLLLILQDRLAEHQHQFNPTTPVGYDRDIVTLPLTSPMEAKS